jgi:hypothetical protein
MAMVKTFSALMSIFFFGAANELLGPPGDQYGQPEFTVYAVQIVHIFLHDPAELRSTLQG